MVKIAFHFEIYLTLKLKLGLYFKGLLVSGMFDTSKKILENHMHLIDEYGFIPNGSRVYYLNRSQPPYFSSMVEHLLYKTLIIACLIIF